MKVQKGVTELLPIHLLVLRKIKYKWLPHPEPSVQSKLQPKAPVTNRTVAVDKEGY